MTLCEKIRKLRTDAGLSQQQLADALSVSRAAVAKWENDNGTPDIENLRALAAYFHCDVDTLLDENKQIEPKIAERVLTISEKSYCGKDCTVCPELHADNCPGCPSGPGNHIHGDCPIATCCRRFHKSSCANCDMNNDCETLGKRSSMLELRKMNQQEQKTKYKKLRRDAAYLRGYVWANFWLLIPHFLESMVAFLYELNHLPILQYIDITLIVLCAAAALYIMLRMSKVEAGFRKAGVCLLAGAVFDVLSTMFAQAIWIPELLLLPSYCMGIYAVYNECYSYSKLMMRIDGELSDSWNRLKKIYFIAYAGSFCSLILSKPLPLLGSLLFFAFLIGAFIAGVLMLVYKFRSAKEISVYS